MNGEIHTRQSKGGSENKPSQTLGQKLTHSSPNILDSKLLSIVNSNLKNERIRTYANVFSELSPEFLLQSRRVIEVGMNEKIFNFLPIFGSGADFFGITLSPEHVAAAKKAAEQSHTQLTIAQVDLRNGFPDGWNDMDLALDIYSASHYEDVLTTATALGKVLRPGGYIAMAIGDDFLATAEYVRAKLLQTGNPPINDPPIFVYRTNDPESVDVYPDTEKDDLVETVARQLEMNGYKDLSVNSPEKNVLDALADAASIVGKSVITHFDLGYVGKYKNLQNAGFEQIKQFHTADSGIGFIAKKKIKE